MSPNASSLSQSRSLPRSRRRDGRRPEPEKDQNKEQERLAACAVVMNEVLNVPDNVPQDMLDKAECIVVIPSMTKVALGVGGSYGRGAMVCRSGKAFNGSWGAPAMYAIEGGSFGLQLGAESTDVVLMVMNPRGVEALLGSKVKLGAEASAAAGPKGRQSGLDGRVHARRNPQLLTLARSVRRRLARGHVAAPGRRRDGTGLRTQDQRARDHHRHGVRCRLPARPWQTCCRSARPTTSRIGRVAVDESDTSEEDAIHGRTAESGRPDRRQPEPDGAAPAEQDRPAAACPGTYDLESTRGGNSGTCGGRGDPIAAAGAARAGPIGASSAGLNRRTRISIDRNGRTITIASSRGPRSSFVADGRAQTERAQNRADGHHACRGRRQSAQDLHQRRQAAAATTPRPSSR